jgi:aryl-phospho-beta-D-glucosidase BglC (GH1 family)
MARIAKKIAFVCIIFAFFVGPMISTQANAASSAYSAGWGGYITSTSSAETTLTDLQSHGYTLLRYEASAPFLPHQNSRHLVNFQVLDYIVNRAQALGIVVIIDPVHNYPESTCTTLQSHFTEWQAELVRVGTRYNNRTNVILECVNEYKLSDALKKFQTIVNTLRSSGIILPLHFNYMWESVGALTPPKDTLNKVSIGHHIYGDHNTDASYMKSGETWVQYCTRIGLEARMKKMFTSTDHTWFGYALSQGTKVLITEIGGSNKEVMTPYNVAFVMRALEYAKMYGVNIVGFRTGELSNLQTYESKAQQYFQRPLFTP